MNGYGVPLGPGSHHLGGATVSLTFKDSDVIEYVRKDPQTGLTFTKLLSSTLTLVPLPIYPVLIPRYVTRFILVEFENPLLVGPEETVSFYFLLPVDLAIYAYSEDEKNYKVIDIIGLSGKPRLALYGPLDRGIIARVIKASILLSEPEPSMGRAVAKMSFRNAGRDVVSLSKVLLDSSPLKLYYEQGTWRSYTQELLVGGTQSSALIIYGEPPKAGLREINDPPELRPPRLFSRTEMPWGV